MSTVTPELLRFVATLNAGSPGRLPHQVTALTVMGFPKLLTPGERWFLGMTARLSQLSESQQARLNEIASKVERGRR